MSAFYQNVYHQARFLKTTWRFSNGWKQEICRISALAFVQFEKGPLVEEALLQKLLKNTNNKLVIYGNG